MEIHCYRMSRVSEPPRWRVFIVIAGDIVYRESFNVETQFDAVHAALNEYARIQKG